MHTLVYEYGGIPPELFPSMPRHILREYVRFCAVHAPSFLKEDLETLCSIDRAGSVDGELIINAPFAESILSRAADSANIVPNDWESMSNSVESEPPPVLHTLIVLATTFRPSLISLLPPTLTHIAMLNIPKIPLHTLPAQLPLVVVLDLSFNPWLSEEFGKTASLGWAKWKKLQLLGLRGCRITEVGACKIRTGVNRGRLTEVEIIFTE